MPASSSFGGRRVAGAPIKNLFPAYAAGATVVVIWGATPAATRLAVDAVDPVFVALARTFLAAALVAPFLLWRRRARPRTGGQWISVMTAGVAGFIVFPLAFSIGVKATSPTHAALINAVIPVFSGFFGVLFERRRPGGRWFLGMAIAVLGVVFLIVLRSRGVGEATVRGDLLCLLSSAMAGLGYVVGSRASRTLGSVVVTFWAIAIAAALLLSATFLMPFGALSISPVMARDVGAIAWGAIFYLGFGATVVAYVLWNWALAEAGVTRIAPLQFAMPLVSLSLAVVLFHQHFSVPLALSVGAVLLGIFLSRRG
ncbi:DMT family transporter [Varunaivibrio sulfuroxidans]|uniref:Drug/metabolite transporter (DMT)-like permease n=1 Tax=Varunaivibrio sulfuroxidans TaxID=1773489 RepID=A0A4V2UNS4_9PROT|nr:DMT family transporter [Varunaivibrio sulfuroxidans]TCS63161.1 drug/metabolite transporter (DMT)-like permease [Varunaivibrio sulfuroxidans]WES31777.1 DMT family transporter [Varunaivibrio sulfuroxidans]